MPPVDGKLGHDGKKLIRRLAASFGHCSESARRYGQCVKLHLDDVQKGACEKEFQALAECFRSEVRKARAQGR